MAMILPFLTLLIPMVQLSPGVRWFPDAMFSQFLAEDRPQSPSQQTILVPGFCTAILLDTHLQDSIYRSSKTSRRQQPPFGPRVILMLFPRRVGFVPLGQAGVQPNRPRPRPRPRVLRPILESDPVLPAKPV
jgi:hypothetical protein